MLPTHLGGRVLLLALLLVAGAASAASKRVVAVLYFDNNTPQRDYDVLQKGLADMLITDLSAVESLQVVEREKLQKLLDELALQRSRYFDPATAQKLGKGVGAELAVTGALAAFEPALRIDVRLIEVATSKVLLADKVVGPKEKFFDLQQELVARFVAGLKVAEEKPEPKAGSLDLAAALKYSRGLDAADKGDFKAASAQLAEVVREAPDFALGKERYGEFLRRLREAGAKRARALSAEEEALLASIEAGVKKDAAKLKGDELDAYLCHRVMRGNALLWQLARLLDADGLPGGYRYTASGYASVAELEKRFLENQAQLVADAKARRDTLVYMNHSVSCPMAFYRIKSNDFHQARKLGVPFKAHVKVHPTELLLDLVGFAAFGEFQSTHGDEWTDGSDIEVRVAPSPLHLDGSWGKRALELLDDAQKELLPEASRNKAALSARVLDARAKVLLALGRREEALAQWQGYLEANPTSKHYRAFEASIERLLGVSAEAKEGEAALRGCKGAAPHVAREVDRVYDAEGAKGLRRLWGQVEKGCPEVLAQVRAASAGAAAVRGDCALLREALKAGAQPASLEQVCKAGR